MPRLCMPWLLVLLACLLAVPVSTQLEGLDDQEADQPAASQSMFQEVGQSTTESTQPLAAEAPDNQARQEKPARTAAPAFVSPTIGKWEITAAVFLIIYAINVFWGRSVNALMAKKWAEAFTEPGGLFDKNFSSLSAGVSTDLMREAANCFKFYASGRRHVLGVLTTLNLRARQDLLAILWYMINPTEDLVNVEAYMTEASMPPIVVAVGTPRYLRRIARDQADVLKYTKKIQMPKDVAPGWPNDKLHIQTEHSTIIADILSDPRILQTLNPNGPTPKAFKLFRSLHFTNECSEGSHKRVLRFTFALPSPQSVEDLAPLMALVPLFIDLIGNYKLPPDLKKRTEAARAKSDADLEAERRKERLDALAQRKQEKLQEEKARLARLPPEQRQRAEDKLRKAEIDKQMRKRSVRVG